MEFLKRVAAVRGRLVTSVMLRWPSGHISFRTGLALHEREKGAEEGASLTRLAEDVMSKQGEEETHLYT